MTRMARTKIDQGDARQYAAAIARWDDEGGAAPVLPGPKARTKAGKISASDADDR